LPGSRGADATGGKPLRNEEVEALLKLFISMAAMRAQQMRTSQLNTSVTAQPGSTSSDAHSGQGNEGTAFAGAASPVPSDRVGSAARSSEVEAVAVEWSLEDPYPGI
jgi:hypothetical protein